MRRRPVVRSCLFAPVATSFTVLLLLASSGFLRHALRAQDPPAKEAKEASTGGIPDGVSAGYRKLSDAIRSENLGELMPLFGIAFLFESSDGSSLDRGPWKRYWSDNFELKDYDAALFEPREVLEKEESRFVGLTRRVLVFRKTGSATKRLEEALLVDTWVQEEGAWTLLGTVEKELRSSGVVMPQEDAALGSPRIRTLREDLARDPQGSLDAFWKEVDGKAPLVEPIVGDDARRWVTFLWRSNGREEAVFLRGVAVGGATPNAMARLEGSDVFFLTERVAEDARFSYQFEVLERVQLPGKAGVPPAAVTVRSVSPDPLNPSSSDGASLARMPMAPASVPREGGPAQKGSALKRMLIRSEALEESRVATVYTPPGYESLNPAAKAVYLFAGGNYESRQKAQQLLDSLVGLEKIPPVVVVMVHSEGSRRPDLEFSDEFVQFIAEELVREVRKEFRVSQKPGEAVVGGTREGAALAAWSALEHPELFGGVLLECGEYWLVPPSPDASSEPRREFAKIPRRFAVAPARPLRFYVAVGNLETDRAISASRHLRDVLEARGYPITYTEISGNHNAMTWLDTLAEGLVALLGR